MVWDMVTESHLHLNNSDKLDKSNEAFSFMLTIFDIIIVWFLFQN